MQFPIVKKEDKSLALEVPDDLLQKLTSKLSPQAEAQLKESQEKVAELEEKLAKVDQAQVGQEAKTMNDFTPLEKAEFVIAWAKELSSESKAVFAEGVGFSIVKVTGAEAKVEENPRVIEGKTDKPGYRYFEHVNYSVKE